MLAISLETSIAELLDQDGNSLFSKKQIEKLQEHGYQVAGHFVSLSEQHQIAMAVFLDIGIDEIKDKIRYIEQSIDQKELANMDHQATDARRDIERFRHSVRKKSGGTEIGGL